MNKVISTHIWSVLLLSLVAFILSGCGVKAPTITFTLPSPTVAPLRVSPIPRQSPTATPPYIHYIPSKRFHIHLEFDFPGSWVFSEQKMEAGLMVIGLEDPQFRTVPTRAPNEPHGTPSDFGSVAIWVWPVKPGQTLDTVVEAHKQGSSGSSWIKALNDYEITIDGYDASVFEYQIDFAELYTSLMFERDIFFAVQDQIYQITFKVAEKDRGGEFEQGYEYFFNSLKIVP